MAILDKHAKIIFEHEKSVCIQIQKLGHSAVCTSEKTHQTKTSFAPLKMMIEVGDSRKRNEQDSVTQL